MSLPPGWETGTDDNGHIYYVNSETKVAQWEPPATWGASSQLSAPSAPPSYGEVESEKGHLVVAEAVQAHPAVQGTTVTQQPGISNQPPPPTVVIVERASTGMPPPPGAPSGGAWIQEKYCGIVTWVIALFVCCCVCCCPCDERTVYLVNGTRYNMHGAIVQNGC